MLSCVIATLPNDKVALGIHSLGLCISNEDVEEKTGGADVDLAKFQEIAASLTTPNLDEVIEAFSVFDQNGNGYIALGELKHVMKNLGEGLSDAELDGMSAQAEPDDEGQVNIRHFVTKLLAD